MSNHDSDPDPGRSAPRARSRIEPLPPASPRSRYQDRVRAGLLVESRLVGTEISEHWQAAVRSAEFDPDECSRDILAADPGSEVDDRLEQRSAQLLRELLMASQATAGNRRGRRRAKTGAAVLLSQLYMLLVWGGMFLAAILLLRLKGGSVDGFLDRLLSIFH